MHYRLTEASDADIESILAHTTQQFGPKHRDKYAALIKRSVETVAAEPSRPSSRERRDLGEGIRSYHLELAAGRRGAALHMLYYVPGACVDGTDDIIVLRVLHDGMEPSLHIALGFE